MSQSTNSLTYDESYQIIKFLIYQRLNEIKITIF